MKLDAGIVRSWTFLPGGKVSYLLDVLHPDYARLEICKNVGKFTTEAAAAIMNCCIAENFVRIKH